MNVVDLELYRWQLHRAGTKFHRLKQKTKFAWSLESGAFISMLPRQSGNTELLIRIAKILQEEKEDFIFVVAHNNMRNIILSRLSMDPKKIEVIMTATTAFNFKNIENKEQINLLIDEYMLIDRHAMREMFKMNWKSISMTGGLKL